MYVRRDRKKNAKGEEVGYLSIAHNIVEDSPKGKRPKPIVFAMVLNRLVDPKSKRACNEWVKSRHHQHVLRKRVVRPGDHVARRAVG